MKKYLIAIIFLSLATLLFADGTGRIAFIPKKSTVGTWGPSGQYLRYWVLAPNNTYYNLGEITDARAKAMYATVLTAMATGKGIELGIWALTSTQINVSNGMIWEIPEYCQIGD